LVLSALALLVKKDGTVHRCSGLLFVGRNLLTSRRNHRFNVKGDDIDVSGTNH